MVGARLGVLPGVATNGGLCEGCHQGRDGQPCLLLPEGSSTPAVEGGAPRTTDGGSFLGVLHWETGVDATEEVHCSHSKCWFMAMAMSQGGSMVSAGEGVSAGLVVGA